MQRKGATSLGDAALIGIVVLAVLVVTGVVNPSQLKLGSVATTGQTTGQLLAPQAPATTGSFVCQPNNGYNTLGVAVRDGLVTTTTLYTPVSVAAVDSNNQITTSATSSGATTLTFTNENIPCVLSKLQGQAMILAGSGATTNYATAPFDLSQKLQDQVVLVSSNTTNLQFVIRQVGTGTNMSGPGNPDVQSANETAPVTMGAGDVRTRIIELSGVTGNRQFGSSLGVIFAIDTADSAVFSDKSMSLTSGTIGLTEIPCPVREVQFDSANRCYSASAIKTSDGVLSLTFTQSADLGNPGTTADPRVYINDKQCFEEDGKVVCDTFDKAGNNVGVGRQQVGFDNS